MDLLLEANLETRNHNNIIYHANMQDVADGLVDIAIGPLCEFDYLELIHLFPIIVQVFHLESGVTCTPTLFQGSQEND